MDLTGKAAREQLATFVAWLEEYDLEASREERTFSVWLSSLLDAPLRQAPFISAFTAAYVCLTPPL